jgi:hypothetical protein
MTLSKRLRAALYAGPFAPFKSSVSHKSFSVGRRCPHALLGFGHYVGTAIAHLAGALGVPVWAALSVSAHWRWLLKRDDSLWYPMMRLFAQGRWGDWSNVMQRMTSELRLKTRSS